MSIVDFDIWANEVPFMDVGDPEFSDWFEGVPVVGGTTSDDSTLAGVGRRRAFILD